MRSESWDRCECSVGIFCKMSHKPQIIPGHRTPRPSVGSVAAQPRCIGFQWQQKLWKFPPFTFKIARLGRSCVGGVAGVGINNCWSHHIFLSRSQVGRYPHKTVQYSIVPMSAVSVSQWRLYWDPLWQPDVTTPGHLLSSVFSSTLLLTWKIK